ncbi:COBW domain-containing protein 1 isoform X1 [Iris pallida]|uniref:COBW domain-containing protein 1 isoform X1 n=1 Tax=Iris pallida TaxID=29817 RepID=A0AAX6E1B0_IRIPA|nr:COBW domain-containing protein 1 isoform X1 [Iris pallida]
MHIDHLEALLQDSKASPVQGRHDYSVRTLCIYEQHPVDLVKFSHGLKIFFGRRSLAWIYITVKEFCMSIIHTNFIHYRLMTCKIISLYVGSDELGRLFHFPNLLLEIAFL